jgi:hypothetical protein
MNLSDKYKGGVRLSAELPVHHAAMPTMNQPFPGHDVRILDAKHFDGPDSLVAMLGFLGAESEVSTAVAGLPLLDPDPPYDLDHVAT